MFIDTHTHLFSSQFDTDREEVVNRAVEAGVEKLLLPNIDVSTIDAMFQLVEKYPKNCYPMLGLHPSSVEENVQKEVDIIKKAVAKHPEIIAIGEIGMDLYWDTTFLEEQRYAFREFVELAKELNLPIVIHAREAFDEIFSILDALNDEKLTGVFHCFTGNAAQAQHILRYGGFYLGIGGVITYKKTDLAEVLQNIPLQLILLETDSPYLAPVPRRGKRNESAYVLHVAEKLAEVYGVSLKTIEDATTENACKLFQI